MRTVTVIVVFLLLVPATLSVAAQGPDPVSVDAEPDFRSRFRGAIQRHLGKPYVWGSSGIKSYDCSGFVWRVMLDSGILLKRTTARKYYLSLPKAAPDERWNFGTLVFFDDLKHVGIVDERSRFYHAQVSRGTNLSNFEPYWRPKITGFRKLPLQPAALPQDVR